MTEKELVISVNSRDKSETPHGKVSDSVVDRLLLRYLSYRESCSMQKAVLTYLVMGNRLPEPFNEFHHLSGIAGLIYESSRRALGQ